MNKVLKVKDIAKQYGVPAKAVIDELISEGIEAQNENSVIPDDMVELIELHFAELYDEEVVVEVEDKKSPKKAVKKPAGKPEDVRREHAGHGAKGGKPVREFGSDHSSAGGEIELVSPVIVKVLAEAIGKKPNELITELMKLGELAGINQAMSDNNAKKVAKVFGFDLVIGSTPKPKHTSEPVKVKVDAAADPAALKVRPPVVTFMGHVDHGKTSLQDAVRHTNVVAGEAGAITQHIGASTVIHKGKAITFIDTPGHAAFSNMRARGANVTDIVVLVVSATEGFKPQTIEALNHALTAKVPIIVAMNKMDLPDADPDKILLNMQQNNLFSEDWGGNVGTVRVSAKTGKGLSDLLDRVLLEAEILELKAVPTLPAEGTVLEAQMEIGLGPTANILVQNGTLKVGDVILCGEHYGKVRSLLDDKGQRIKSAGPSIPVKVVGLTGVPEAGDRLTTFDSEKEAKAEASRLVSEKRGNMLASSAIVTAEDLFSKLNSDSISTLNIIIKSDVKGSGEAIAQSLAQLPSDKIKAVVVSSSVGSITENDIMLAAATNSILVGFHVRVAPGVNDLAKKQKVEIRLYSIIYELLEDITDALAGKLEPEKREKALGTARILQIFELTKGPKICGCKVEDGVVKVGAKARVFRDKELIYNGEVASLRRFQDDVKEVKTGFECGIRLDNFADFIENDVIEVYEIELKKATL